MARLPLTWTMLVWSANASATWATSPSVTGAPSTILTGMRAKSATSVGLELRRTLYSRLPILAVPAGRMTFDVDSAFTTS